MVQIDEKMLNLKCESHRGRSSSIRTDALCIIEVDSADHISGSFAVVIPDKRAATVIPIIQENVAAGAYISTDEHPSYSSLASLGFNHFTVCHKYEFLNRKTG